MRSVQFQFEFIEGTIIFVLDNNTHNDKDYTGIKSALLFSAEGLKQSALTNRAKEELL